MCPNTTSKIQNHPTLALLDDLSGVPTPRVHLRRRRDRPLRPLPPGLSDPAAGVSLFHRPSECSVDSVFLATGVSGGETEEHKQDTHNDVRLKVHRIDPSKNQCRGIRAHRKSP